ncbi:MAG: type II secretion system GspH family protein [Candidatus Omnitrophica bacterium]|nr:type II secretion system GspH family protein [Candidatus Omnitrophota bacterium]MCM8801878.1 type II secretion system GspH family protein [Candidatus Omnitrophota bacterium]
MKIYKNGFTFLEIMVAIGIFGIVATVCLTNFLMCLKEIKIINDKVKIILLAEKKIEEIKLKGEEIKEGRGNFDEPDSEYIWEIKISDITIKDTEQDIEMIPYKLIIEWKDEYYSTFIPFLKTSLKNE